MTRRTHAALAIVAVLATAGCSAGDDEAPTPTVTTTAPIAAEPTDEPSTKAERIAAAENAPGQAGEMDAEARLPFGQPALLSNGSTVMVHSVNVDPAPGAPAPAAEDAHWVAVDVEGCWSAQTPANSVYNNAAWTVRDSESRQYQPASVTYQQFPQPAYGYGDTPAVPEECVRGWVSYEIPNGAQLAEVKYQSQMAGPFYWSIG